MKIIKEFKGKYRWLSNFTRCEVQLEGQIYPSTEAAYQASKTLLQKERMWFINVKPGKAKRLGKKVTLRADWKEVKLSVMEDLNKQKYNKEPFRTLLLATGIRTIQEGNTWGDTFWGICKGKGHNHLGKIIMKIREDLRND